MTAGSESPIAGSFERGPLVTATKMLEAGFALVVLLGMMVGFSGTGTADEIGESPVAQVASIGVPSADYGPDPRATTTAVLPGPADNVMAGP